jgi:hypothetical protein
MTDQRGEHMSVQAASDVIPSGPLTAGFRDAEEQRSQRYELARGAILHIMNDAAARGERVRGISNRVAELTGLSAALTQRALYQLEMSGAIRWENGHFVLQDAPR